jgi:HSP20 family protein
VIDAVLKTLDSMPHTDSTHGGTMIVIRHGRARPMPRRSSEIDDVVRSLISGQRASSTRPAQAWRPALDVFATDGSFEVVAELAGMAGDDIEVVIEGDVLTIRGDRARPQADRCLSYYEARIPSGPFSAEVAIPFDIEWDETRADYENGLLTVSLPRRRSRTVTVRDASRPSGEESDQS